MKKLSAILMACAMAVSMLTGCGNSNESQDNTKETEPVEVNVTALKGPTAMGMVSLMDDVDNGKVDS